MCCRLCENTSNSALLCLGVKPYACTMCDMRFIQRYQLERHSLTHTGTYSLFWTLTLSFPLLWSCMRFMLMFTWLLQTRVCIALCQCIDKCEGPAEHLYYNTYTHTLYMKWHDDRESKKWELLVWFVVVPKKLPICTCQLYFQSLYTYMCIYICKLQAIYITFYFSSDMFCIWIDSTLWYWAILLGTKSSPKCSQPKTVEWNESCGRTKKLLKDWLS